MFERRVAGVVLTYVPSPANLELLASWGVPLLFADCLPPAGFETYPSVVGDGEGAGLEIGRHFSGHGYRSWAFVGYTSTWSSQILRERGFRTAAAEAGATLTLIEGGNLVGSADAAVWKLIVDSESEGLPRAFFAGNEPLAKGTLRALRRAELRVPEDVAVIGYDDFPGSSRFGCGGVLI